MPAIPSAPPVSPPPVPPPVHKHGRQDVRTRRKKPPVALTIGLAVCCVVLAVVAVYVLRPPAAQPKGATAARQDSAPAMRSAEKNSAAAGSKPSPAAAPTSAESAKTEEFPPFTTPPDTPPDTPREPRPETAKLWEAANEAIKEKDAKKAIDLLEKYLDDPFAPEADKAIRTLSTLKDITSDEFILEELAAMSEEELIAFEDGRLRIVTRMSEDLQAMFVEAMRRKLPEAKRRLAMKNMPDEAAKAKDKAAAAKKGEPKNIEPKNGKP